MEHSVYLSHIVDNIIFGINAPGYPIIPVETTFWDDLEICLHFIHTYNQHYIYIWQTQKCIIRIQHSGYPLVKFY